MNRQYTFSIKKILDKSLKIVLEDINFINIKQWRLLPLLF